MSQQIVNTPIAGTFRWLKAGGTEIEVPAEQNESYYALRKGEERTIVLEDDAAAVLFRADLEKGSVLHLIQIRRQDGGPEGLTRTDVQVTCAEDAQFHWYRVVLGGDATYDNCSVALQGEGSSFTADIGYRLDGKDRYDANCEAIHTGRRTESAISASGVLSDRAHKLLRTTIDLRRGCAGAVGNENEDVLLMDETVQNVSVPMILCTEEDVVGNHGASIGQPDERLLYYMASRGIDAETACGMLAQAKIEAVIGKIPYAQVQARVREQLRGGDGGEEA